MNTFSPFNGKTRLGILGGGQLGRMLLTEVNKLNVEVSILDPDPHAPCSVFEGSFVQGDFKDFDTVMAFAENVDIITIEIENVNIEALRELKKKGKKVYPDPEILAIVKDKGIQKQFYLDNNIPTAKFELVSADKAPENLPFSFPFVQKTRTGGYDGRGVQIIRTEADLANFWDGDTLLEEMVPFEKEIAVIVSRGHDGEVKTFPSVEMEFHPTANLVEFLVSPSSLTQELKDKASAIAEKIAASFNLVGIMAVEMFLTKTGEILVNEVAPRPHNSGHQTIEGNVTSQYAQLFRTLMELPLGDTSLRGASVMVNLLGADGHDGVVSYSGLDEVLAMPGTYVHLYGKRNTRSFRKMGHITICDDDIEVAVKRAKKVKEIIKAVSI